MNDKTKELLDYSMWGGAIILATIIVGFLLWYSAITFIITTFAIFSLLIGAALKSDPPKWIDELRTWWRSQRKNNQE